MKTAAVRGFVSGRVQGVGFRYFMRRHAEAEGLRGFACNLPDGRVEFLLQGDGDAVNRVLQQLREGPRYAEVTGLQFEDACDSPAVQGFVTR